jgi:peptide/nickel transport system permease protein
MIPTLIGITFIIFMLVALSPGGIGAALRAAGGQVQADAGSRAVQEAYLEDRYGLSDPAPIQYLRWLARISPIKFGQRHQVLPNGEVIAPPRAVPEPPLWSWFAQALPAPVPPAPPTAGTDAPAAITPESSVEDRDRAYRLASGQYARARSAFVAARAQFEADLALFAKAQDRADLVDFRGKPDLDAIQRQLQPPSASDPAQPLNASATAMLEAYARAVGARDNVVAVFDDRLFPQYGLGVIPGVLSLAPPDLGQSFSRSRPVKDLIATALPVTLTINLVAFPIIYIIAIPLGMLAAVRQGRWQDTSIGVLVVALWSVPTVWAGVLAIGYLANKSYLGWFPVGGLHDKASGDFPFLPSVTDEDGFQRGYFLDALWHIALPILCLVYGGFAVLAKQTRAAMLENFSMDFVRTAKAKGVASRDITFRHVFRNSLLPLITMFATVFPATLAGSVVIERIFSVPGMGSMIIEAISLRDREVLLANTLIIAAVNMLALLLADILYALADPRITYK